jgi:NADH-quinone oxidoreductase E subunit
MQNEQSNNVDQLDAVFEGFDRKRHNLIPLLQAVQNKQGYISPDAISKIASFLKISESLVYGTVTFYSQFFLEPQGEHSIKVCQGTACHVRGSGKIVETIEKELGISAGRTTEDLKFSLEVVACFGSCALGPVVVVDDKVYGNVTTDQVKEILERLK